MAEKSGYPSEADAMMWSKFKLLVNDGPPRILLSNPLYQTDLLERTKDAMRARERALVDLERDATHKSQQQK